MPGAGLILAAPASGSGKTLVTAGLLRLFRNRRRRIAGAKAGPDALRSQSLENSSHRNNRCARMKPAACMLVAADVYQGAAIQRGVARHDASILHTPPGAAASATRRAAAASPARSPSS